MKCLDEIYVDAWAILGVTAAGIEDAGEDDDEVCPFRCE